MKLPFRPRLAFAAVIVALFALGPAATIGQAAPKAGSPVTNFGSNGHTLTGFAPAGDQGRLQEMSVRPDGSAVVLGYSRRNFVLARFKPDGAPDPAFGTDGFATGGFTPDGKRFFGSKLATQSDGRIVVAGSTTPLSPRGELVRYDQSGQLDRTFGQGGFVTTSSQPALLAVDSSDRLIVAGGSGSSTSVSRYLADGRPDGAFGQGGSVTFPFNPSSGFDGISLMGGRITIGGPGGVFRLNLDGSPDVSFGHGGTVNTESRGLAVQPDGRVVVTTGSGYVRRLLTDGSPDPAFGTNGTVTVEAGASNSVAIDAQGRVVVGGITAWLGEGSPKDFEIFRLTPDGELDPAFGNGGITSTSISPGSEDTIESVATLDDGRILVAGTAAPPWNLSKFALARYTPAGDLDPGFGQGSGFISIAPVVPSTDRIFDTIRVARGKIVAVGKAGFNAGLARFDSKGKLDPSFGAGGTVSTRFTNSRFGDVAESVTGLPGGQIAVCGSSTAGVAVTSYRSDGSRVDDFGTDGILALPSLRHCDAILRDANGQLLLGGVDFDNEVRLVRLTADGSLDPSYGTSGIAKGPAFSPSGGGFRHLDLDLAPNGDAVIAGDRFGATLARFTDRGTRRHKFGDDGILKLDGHGSSPIFMNRAEAVDVTPNGRIVVGGVSRKRMSIAALTSTGKPVRKFGRNGLVRRKVLTRSVINDLKVQANGTIVGVGSAVDTCGLLQFCRDRVIAVRYKTSGKPDRTFGRKGLVKRRFGVRSKASSVTLGRRDITLAGFAVTATERQQFLLARLNR